LDLKRTFGAGFLALGVGLSGLFGCDALGAALLAFADVLFESPFIEPKSSSSSSSSDPASKNEAASSAADSCFFLGFQPKLPTGAVVFDPVVDTTDGGGGGSGGGVSFGGGIGSFPNLDTPLSRPSGAPSSNSLLSSESFKKLATALASSALLALFFFKTPCSGGGG
jgi:hypothetical protein